MVATGSTFRCAGDIVINSDPFKKDEIGVLKTGAFVIVSFICRRLKKARVIFPRQGYIKTQHLTETPETICSVIRLSPSGKKFLRKPRASPSTSPSTSTKKQLRSRAKLPSTSPPSTSTNASGSSSSDNAWSFVITSSDSESDAEDDQTQGDSVILPRNAWTIDHHRLACETLYDYMWEFCVDIAYDIALDAYYDEKEDQKRQQWAVTLKVLNEITDESVVEEIQATSQESIKELTEEHADDVKEDIRSDSPREVGDLEDLLAMATLHSIMGESQGAINKSVTNARKRRSKRREMKKKPGMCGFRVMIQRGKYGGRSGSVDQSMGSKWRIILDDGTEAEEPLSNVTLL